VDTLLPENAYFSPKPAQRQEKNQGTVVCSSDRSKDLDTMRLKPVSLVFIALTLVAPFLKAQNAGDLLSGTWRGNWGPTPSHWHSVTLDLKWDGKT
jgi:hypothetical protein